MSTLLDLPPELLVPTITLLPLKSLLRFSECSRYARSLANASLRTLDLEFGPPSYLDDLCSTTLRASLHPSNRFFSSRVISLVAKHARLHTANLDGRDREASTNNKMAYKTIVRIHDAHRHEHPTLVHLHSALLSSILGRYRHGLQKIDITVWAFTTPVAKAISELSALRSLSVKVQEPYYIRSPPQNCETAQLAAWQILVTSSAWAGRLLVLRIENADIAESSLFGVLDNNPFCQALSLRKCASIRQTLWRFLAMDWHGRDALHSLVIEEHGVILNNAALEEIGKLGGLQVSLYVSMSLYIPRKRLIVAVASGSSWLYRSRCCDRQ
jgi:hypothetical protein